MGENDEIKPKWNDLARLFYLIRSRKPFQVSEFGSDFSTIVMAEALKLNWNEYLSFIGSKKKEC